MTPQKMLRFGFLSLIGLELGLALAYLAAIWHGTASPDWLDFNGLRSLPSWLQAVLLLTIGCITLGLLLCRQRVQRPLSWVLLLSLTLLCFYGSFDEVTKIHLQLNQYNWLHIYLAILIAIPAVCWRDLVWLWQAHRSILLWVVVGISIFVLGGFGGEAIKQGLHEVLGASAAGAAATQPNRLLFLSEHLRIAVEECSELLGETFILFGIAQFAVISLTDASRSAMAGSVYK